MKVIATPNIPLGHVGVNNPQIINHVVVLPNGGRALTCKAPSPDRAKAWLKGLDLDEFVFLNEKTDYPFDYHINDIPLLSDVSPPEEDKLAQNYFQKIFGSDLFKNLEVEITGGQKHRTVRVYHKTLAVSVASGKDLDGPLQKAIEDLRPRLTEIRDRLNATLDRIPAA